MPLNLGGTGDGDSEGDMTPLPSAQPCVPAAPSVFPRSARTAATRPPIAPVAPCKGGPTADNFSRINFRLGDDVFAVLVVGGDLCSRSSCRPYGGRAACVGPKWVESLRLRAAAEQMRRDALTSGTRATFAGVVDRQHDELSLQGPAEGDFPAALPLPPPHLSPPHALGLDGLANGSASSPENSGGENGSESSSVEALKTALPAAKRHCSRGGDVIRRCQSRLVGGPPAPHEASRLEWSVYDLGKTPRKRIYFSTVAPPRCSHSVISSLFLSIAAAHYHATDEGSCFGLGGRPFSLVAGQGAGGVDNHALATLAGLQENRVEAVGRAVAVKVEGRLVVWVSENAVAEGAPGGSASVVQAESRAWAAAWKSGNAMIEKWGMDLRWYWGLRKNLWTALAFAEGGVPRMALAMDGNGGTPLRETTWPNWAGGKTKGETALPLLAVGGDEAGLRAVFSGVLDLVESLEHVKDGEITLAIERDESVVGAGKRLLREQDVLVDGRIVSARRQAPEALRTTTIWHSSSPCWALPSRLAVSKLMAGTGALRSWKRSRSSCRSWRSCVSSSGCRQPSRQGRRGRSRHPARMRENLWRLRRGGRGHDAEGLEGHVCRVGYLHNAGGDLCGEAETQGLPVDGSEAVGGRHGS
ncbi:hypothetical protein ACSSS7_008360 [Eimeria intestinalis]